MSQTRTNNPDRNKLKRSKYEWFTLYNDIKNNINEKAAIFYDMAAFFIRSEYLFRIVNARYALFPL